MSDNEQRKREKPRRQMELDENLLDGIHVLAPQMVRDGLHNYCGHSTNL